jgi:Protein of unknown function (DUF3592)
MAEAESRAISSGPRATRGARVFVGIFFGVFLLVGLGAGFAFVGRPVARMIDAIGWTPTSCEILSSRVHATSGDDGPTYRVDITYSYLVDGRTVIGSRYKFVSGSTSGRRRKLETVERLAPGMRTPCWFDPDNPAESVIVRGPTGDLAFGLIPLIFAVVGAAGVWGAVAARGPFVRPMAPRPVPSRLSYGGVPRRNTFTRLVPIQGRGAKSAGLALVALFWNGIVSVFVYQIVDNWQRRVFAWPMTLFIIPFVLVGLFLLVVAVMQMLALFNPRPHLTVNAKVLALGDELKLRWVIDGKMDKLRHLTIELVGREEATYRRGTNSHTDRTPFMTLPLVDQSAPLPFDGDTARVTIPRTTMHSFSAPNNKVVWLVKLRGDVLNWPNIEDEFILEVTPVR